MIQLFLSPEMKNKLVFLLVVFSTLNAFSQSFQVCGYVKDKSSGDVLPNAYISVNTGSFVVVANSYGYFSFNVTTTSVKIKITFTGYERLEKVFELKSDTTISCYLSSNNVIAEVNVKGNDTRQIIKEKEVGGIRLTGKEIGKIPSLLGEHDLVKALQLMPGIKMGREGTSGMYVRGGSPGQNLILLDDVPVYNVNHLFGFFSVFTPEAVKSVDIFKGAFPAQYGGRISSVMDIKMREGNLFQSKYDVTIGTLSSKIIAEIPLKKEKASLLFSGRRTYFDVLLSPFNKSVSYDGKTTETNGYYFLDLNTKLFWDIDKWGKVFWSCYAGRDNYYTRTQSDYTQKMYSAISTGRKEDSRYTYNWGNFTTSLRWNKTIGRKLFLNAKFLYSNYSYILDLSSKEEEIYSDTVISESTYQNLSGVKDYGVTADVDFFLSDKQHITLGSRITWHEYIPGKITLKYENSEGSKNTYQQGSVANAIEIDSYIEDKLQLTKHWKMNIGLHHSFFKIDDVVYSSLQPRIRSSFAFGDWALKCSGGYMVQPVHNLINNSTALAVDIWVPSEANIKPSTSLQFDLGVDWVFNLIYSLSVEGYWRNMNNILTYKKGESFINLYENWTDKVISGKGESYGAEILARKNEGKTTGWLGYTWSVSNQQFNLLNNGISFPASFDRRHYFTVSVSHQFSSKIQLSGSWIVASGEPITISTTAYDGDRFYGNSPIEINYLGLFTKRISAPNQIIYYSSLNGQRLPSYHRLDIGVDFKKEKKKGTRIWSFSVYNVYGRNNPSMVSIEENENGELFLKNSSPFRFLPSLSYRFIFK
jgi:hypothetical protein